MRTGVLGGTFDPVHLGHLLIAEEARVSQGLDDVLFIPAGQPYFKTDRPVSEAFHRLAMVKLAVASNPHFAASDIEMDRPGPTYTVDTLTELRKRLGTVHELFLILGMDSLADLGRWRRPEEILALSAVVGFARPGADGPDEEMLERIRSQTLGRLQIMDGPLVDISASDIRRRVVEGLSIRHMVPEPVEEYIHRHRLYKGRAGAKKEAV